MNAATEAQAERAITILERAINAAKNSNQNGENAVVIAAEALEGDDWEVLAVGYQALSGKAYHMSDCATCCAPAYKPSPCDCDAPAAQPDLLLAALERIAEYQNDLMNGHEKFEATQDIARAAITKVGVA